MRKRILSWLLVVTLALTLFPTAAFAQQTPIENGLWLTPESHTLNLYEASMGTVTGTFYEGDAIKHAEDGLDMVTWEVGDSGVIHLDKTGSDSEEAVTVWALKEGHTTITARSEGYTETINVTVAAPIRLTMEEPNNMTTLTAPDLVDGSEVTPNDPSVVIAEAQDGVGVTLTAVAPGTTTITVVEPSGTTYDIPVYVDYDQVYWDIDGVLTASTHRVGTVPTYPGAAPTKAGIPNRVYYDFAGWQPEPAKVTSGEGPIYTAQFNERIIYELEADDFTIYVGGDSANAEDLSRHVGYYAADDTRVTGFPENTTVVSDAEDIVSVEQQGDTWIATPHTAGRAALTATYSDGQYSSNVTFYVTVENSEGYHTVTFNVSGKGVERQVVKDGDTPVPTISTDRDTDYNASYTFAGWQPEIGPVTADTTFVAQYDVERIQYTVLFKDWDGTTLKEQTCYFGDTSTAPADPTRPVDATYCYTFTGWSPEIAPVTEDVTYTAQYNEVLRKYTILFKNWDGSTIKSMLLEYGATPDVSTLKPTRADTTENGKTTKYEFKGWNPDITMVTKDATYTATYNATTKGDPNDPELANKEFNISFVNWDGKVLETVKVKGGTKPAYSGKTPTRESTKDYRYTFTGWSPEIVEATEDATYTAQFKQFSAQTVVLTENDLAEAAKNPMTTIRFPYGILYINQDGIKELQAIKAQITIEVVKKSSNGDMMTIRFLKGEDETLITADMDGLMFLATYMDSGDVVALADDDKTKDSDFASVTFSVINQAGAYVPIQGSCSIRTESTYVRFDDLLGNGWAKGYIDFCSARGLVDGFGDYKFQPESTITRAQAATIAHRLFGSPKPYGGKAYDDVSPFEWYAMSISWATGNNLIDGLADIQFSPNTGITRADQALLLYRMAQLMNYECKERVKLAKFHDAGLLKTGDQTTAMEWAVATGIIEGTTNVTLSPRNPTTRAEFCAMMYRFISYLTIWDDSEAVEFN